MPGSHALASHASKDVDDEDWSAMNWSANDETAASPKSL
jgi:hypothetical protein